MIECVFTLDYEIYGNGEGSLKELVYEPAERLKAIFLKWNARCVVFVEVAELEIIESAHSDPAIDLVKQQIRDFYGEGFELGLHLHPQWYNARFEDAGWRLDYSEYNLCALPRARIDHIIRRSTDYLTNVLEAPEFTPVSFRAGNWLLQPTRNVAKSLADHGIKIDSSLYKGGVQHGHDLDYRLARKNGYYWRFSEDVNIPDREGILLEIPTYTKMVPAWEMLSSKRIGLHKKGGANNASRQGHGRPSRLRDFLRLRYPMKLDICRLTPRDLKRMVAGEVEKDRRDAGSFRPIVAIGHTKDLMDTETVESFLSYLREAGIRISTFRDVLDDGVL